ncbi:MAG: prolyl oligopeptidase family serine peptidase [Cyclobacteriaceae bacterium]
MRYLTLLFLIALPSIMVGQSKKVLDHSAYDEWRKIENQAISTDGDHIHYSLISHGYADPVFVLKTNKGEELLRYDRGNKGQFSADGKYVTFTIVPGDATVRDLKRVKTKEEELPQDTLAIYDIENQSLTKLPYLQSVTLPEKWSGWMAYQTILQPDTTKKKAKKSNKDNGYPLTVRRLSDGATWELPFVQSYAFSEIGSMLSAISGGNDSTVVAGVYVFNTEQPAWQNTHSAKKGKYENLAWDEAGNQLAFTADLDTTRALVRNPGLYHWTSGSTEAGLILDSTNDFVKSDMQVNPHQKPMFSQNGQKLYFEIMPNPIQQDTSLLEDEIVNVEVWSYKDPRLYTQQEIDKKNDVKKGYSALLDINSGRFTQLGSEELPDVMHGNEGNAGISLAANNQPYLQSRTWEGFPDYNDLYIINQGTGETKLIATKVRGSAELSPMGRYAYWYDRVDSAWFTYNIGSEKLEQVTFNDQLTYYDEENDSPDFPSPYGLMSWTEDDSKMLIYDRFDVWEVDPNSAVSPINLTRNGRSTMTKYRYVKLDDEERFISKGQKLLFTAFRESNKGAAVVSMTYGRSGMATLASGDLHYKGFKKARDSKELIFQQENFEVFPDIHATTLDWKSTTRISTANPQQAEYNWGTAEIHKFTSLDGKSLEGLLIKPENFDPTKKYPMLVNFYETSSDGLNRHREPSPGRSTMNYSFYASRGYVIFNPDVVYREGYPGESAYNCVMPGVLSLIEEGFVDKDRVGVQGHSWGGYQIAYLVTQTDLFRCAEAGAPVPNMVSAYGGIRWWTGLSRMFQYEHTQSRIGGTLWQYPLRFIENSPIFYIDKINTPLLLMHNDADGHVPWYQGIELFVALRRLGKPSWMLNYQGEPHWPLKLQNKIDFNVRLQQYFDYYLKDAPMPEWMDKGVPAIQMGIDQNLDLIDGNE